MKLDNLARETHDICPAKYDLILRQHYASRGKSPALGFGGVLHEGLATWYRTNDSIAALEAVRDNWRHQPPVDDYRTLEKCLKVMTEYVKEYPHETWQIIGADHGEPIVEKSFTLATGLYLPCTLSWLGNEQINTEPCRNASTPTQSHCVECGRSLEPIEYGGIIDLLASFNNNTYVVDHKTTSRMGDSYFLQFKPDNQMTGYIWAAGELAGRPAAGALINAVGIYKSQATKFERQLTTRSAQDIERWRRDLHRVCIEIKTNEQDGVWPMRSKACTLYGRCEFHNVHSISDHESQLKILEQQFVKRVWDYENRDSEEEHG